MNGTASSATRPMRLTPPKMMSPRKAVTAKPEAHVGTFRALWKATAMLLDWMPGSRRPQLSTATAANRMPYQRIPRPRSM